MPSVPPEKIAGFLTLMSLKESGLGMRMEMSFDLTAEEVRIVRAFIARIKAERADPKPSAGVS